MYIWTPATRYSQTIAFNPFARGQSDRVQPSAARSVNHAAAHIDRRASNGCGRLDIARIYHCADINPLGCQICCGAPTVVIVGKDGHLFAGGHPIAIDIGAHSSRQHNARPVIVAKGNRPLGCARGQQGAFRINPPQNLPWFAIRACQMIGAALERAINAMIIGAVNCCADHQAHIVHRA